MNESANAVQKCTCMTFLPWFPSLSLCLRCAIPDRMVVAMQMKYETYIVPMLMINNITVPTAAHFIATLCRGVAVAVFPTYMGGECT